MADVPRHSAKDVMGRKSGIFSDSGNSEHLTAKRHGRVKTAELTAVENRRKSLKQKLIRPANDVH